MNILPFRGAAVAAGLLALAVVASCGESPTGSGGRNVARMDVVGGDLQTAKVGTELPQAVVVRVLNDKGKPVSGQIVNFVVTAGGGSVFAGSSSTNADGEARERWTLGTAAGDTQRVEVRAVDATTGVAQVFATFRAVATPDAPARVERISSSSEGTTNAPLADSVAVKVSDRYGNAVSGVQVTWAARSGDGTFSPATSVTDARGEARSAWTLGTIGVAQATATVAGVAPLQLSAVVKGGAPTRVVASVDSLSFTALRQSARLTAAATDPFGNPLPEARVLWMSLDTGVVQVGTYDGTATAWGTGTGRLVAYVDGTQARDTVTVRVRQVGASIELEARSTYSGPRRSAVGDSMRFYVSAVRDANGYLIPDPELEVTLSDPSLARVGPTGYIVPLQTGSFSVTITSGAATVTRPVQVLPVRKATSLLAGGGSVCLLQDAGEAWCHEWFTGDDQFPDVTLISGNVVGGAVGDRHACFLREGGEAYCAGGGNYGQLGNGQYQRQPGDTAGWYSPVYNAGVVRGGLRFTSLAVGQEHSCGVAEGGVLYCWGRGSDGQLGSGVRLRELDPTPVTGSETLRFQSVYAIGSGTCALSTQGSVFCWGIAGGKNLGSTPTPVQPPRAFTQITMGLTFVCGLDATGRASCWGTTKSGEIGNGVTEGSWDTAQPVSGGHVFTQIKTGVVHTCGLTPDGEVFCWGYNWAGQVGVGQWGGVYSTPQPLHEERRFKDLAAAGAYTCAVSLRDITLCWGQRPGYKEGGHELHPTPIGAPSGP